MFTFKKNYLIYAILLFLVEVIIGLYVRDQFIRPYGGDFLVVILIYYFVRAFWNQSSAVIAICVLLFSYVVEFGQYFKMVEILGLKGNKLAEIIIGTGFSWWDMLAYTLGIICVYVLDNWKTFSKTEPLPPA